MHNTLLNIEVVHHIRYWQALFHCGSFCRRHLSCERGAETPGNRGMAAMKIAATELMAETTNSDGSFQGFALRALSVPRPLSLLRQIPLSLPPYAGLSCPEHEGRLPLTLTALVSGRGRAADTDALAQGHRRSGTGIGREASLPFPRRVRHQGRSSASARPSAPTSGKTLRMRPKFHLDGLFSRVQNQESTFQSVISHVPNDILVIVH